MHDAFAQHIDIKVDTQTDTQAVNIHFQDIFANAPIGIFISTPEGRYLQVNSEYARIFGYDDPDQMVTHVSDIGAQLFVRPMDREVFKQEMHLRKRLRNFKLRLKRRDNRPFWASVNAMIKATRDEGIIYEGFLTDISDHKLAEEALRRSEQYNRVLFNESPVGLAVCRMDGTLVDVNPAYARITGMTVQEALQKTYWQITPREYSELEHHQLRLLEENGRCGPFEKEYVHKAGHRVPVRLHGLIIELEGAPHILSAVEDISELKKVEHDLKEKNTLLEGILDNVPDILSVKRPDLSIVRYNMAGLDFLGMSPEHVRERKCYELLGRQTTCQPCATLEAIESKQLVSKEIFIPELQKHLNCRVNPIIDDTGEVAYTIELLQDISQQKQVEAALRQSEERFHSLFDSMTELVVMHELVFNDHGDVENYVLTECNKAFSSTTGISRENAVGKLGSEVYGTPTAPYLTEYSQVALSGTPFTFTTFFEPMGKYFEITALSPRKNHFATIASDVTAQKQAAKERETLQAQLLQAQKMESLGILAGGVAHDFNNLLQAMSGNIELLARGKSANHPDTKRLKTVTRAMDRAAQLVQQLLFFSRKSESRRVPIDLNQEVRHAVQILERIIPRMITLEVRLEPLAWALRADPVQIEQVLLNLANNAVDAMPDGGRLTLETMNVILDEHFVRTHPEAAEGRQICLRVTDTGKGMEKETLRHVFDPFFTTKEVGRGTGLGLASVYGIVKSHGGSILCSSEPDQGTTFQLFFPATNDDVNDVPEQRIHTAAQGGQEQILVVDDEPEIRDLTREVLEMLGYSVHCVSSGEEALQAYQERPGHFDLVLLDLNMPGMGGQKCLQELLRLDPSARVVIASGYAAKRLEGDPLSAKAKGVLGKPYQLKDLAAMVRNVLDQH
ncbi:hybrid sensor histidine kinase/response regulator [Desulfonatronum thioautotrophicum]|uniref:hybrid sensor histidine kinase/response regulator n=1 Tax=Desulfonatronum thioautotrophicum TaxID=617001 RepID=UPI0005EBD221|nr:PAS domain-containing sensor histidine kinase [Desulfonatronum thioautotrophicum]